MKVNEILSSFQGEGPYIGLPATFVRLSGCNLNCGFCDTDFDDYKELSVELVKEAILQHCKNHNTSLLVITGGEPLLQYEEVKELIEDLEYTGLTIQIETNGSIKRIPISGTSYVISPKENIREVFEFYKDYDLSFFKFIITCQKDIDLIKELQEEYDYQNLINVQPEYSKAVELTELILLNNMTNIRISGQLHKYLNQR